MSPLWSDMAFARAALTKLEQADSATTFTRETVHPSQGATAAGERVRRLLYPRLSSFAL
jgi:hypothetical protein